MKKEGFQTFLLFALIGILCVFSKSAKAGASEGIRLCEDVIIPSLLPVLIICTLIVNSRAAAVVEKLFGFVFERTFKLPRCCAGAVILGLTGGYPTGAVLTYRLYNMRLIDESSARRIMRFNFCGGFAFIITAVGTVTYGSTKTGVILFSANLISAVIILIIGSVGAKRPTNSGFDYEYPAILDALPDAVESTVKAVLNMSAYIILFSAFSAVLKPPENLTPLIEITSGVCKGNLLPLPYCAFFLAFGGVCIHLQVYGYLRKMKIKYAEFLLYRIAAAVLSFCITKIYCTVFPQSEAVFSNVSSPVHEFSSGGVTLSMLMIIGCAVVVFDIENRKLKLI